MLDSAAYSCMFVEWGTDRVGEDTGDVFMAVVVVSVSEVCVLLGVLVMAVVDEGMGHAGKEEAGNGRVAAVDPVDNEDEEAEDEDEDNRTAVIRQYFL
ncbi:hypothetical protein NDU88_004789 [Pleurodeles waltl]|uniref:Uncharacterized protein n=1 Tax=Pleurodeles waltl TaxID=8319 RepID=A0AAV7MW56_PLEWA|nr:hypothetical protein NDU88_004789 [Pleurodeles waltl]